MLDQSILFSLPEQQINKIKTRIFAKIDQSGDCWNWTGALTKGYGVTGIGRAMRNVYVHQLMYALFVGKKPDGAHILHHCDNPKCCKPSHLFAGTNRDNIADMIAKGRQKRGEDTNASKLTNEQTTAIMSRFAAGASALLLAEEYGVALASIYRISRGVTWQHLDIPSEIREAAATRRPTNLRLDESAARDIRERYAAGGVTQAELASEYCVHVMLVNQVLKGRIWKHVEISESVEKAIGQVKPRNHKMDPDKVRDIRRRYDAGIATQDELAAEYGTTQGNISLIVRRKAWVDVK